MKKLFLFLILLAVIACSKDPGVGGSSSISGTVMVVDIVVGNPVDTTYAAGEDVFLLYGTDTIKPYDDSFETSWNGTYKFEYLRKGTYTVFVYSDDYPNSNKNVPLFSTIEVTKNGTDYTLDDIVVYK